VPIPSGSNKGLGDVVGASAFENLRHMTGGGFSYGGRETQRQGMWNGVSTRGALRLRAVLRAAGGRLRPRLDRRRGGAAPSDPGRARGRLALRRLPAARRRSARAVQPPRVPGRAAGRLAAG